MTRTQTHHGILCNIGIFSIPKSDTFQCELCAKQDELVHFEENKSNARKMQKKKMEMNCKYIFWRVVCVYACCVATLELFWILKWFDAKIIRTTSSLAPHTENNFKSLYIFVYISIPQCGCRPNQNSHTSYIKYYNPEEQCDTRMHMNTAKGKRMCEWAQFKTNQ